MRPDTFWLVTTIVCLVWYTSLTLYVSVRGVPEIVHLIRVLRGQKPPEPEARP